jgi:hypothetical protein
MEREILIYSSKEILLKALAQAIPVYSTEQEKPIAKYDFIFQEINLSHFVRKIISLC